MEGEAPNTFKESSKEDFPYLKVLFIYMDTTQIGAIITQAVVLIIQGVAHLYQRSYGEKQRGKLKVIDTRLEYVQDDYKESKERIRKTKR